MLENIIQNTCCGCSSAPDKVVAPVSEPLHNVCLIVFGADHDHRHHSIGHCLAQFQAELMTCKQITQGVYVLQQPAKALSSI